MNTKQKIGRACMIVGILLILGALALLGYNQWDANRADQASQDALGKLEETLTETIEDKTKDEEPVVQPELDPEQEMTVTDIDGWGYIGYLSIPSIGLELPVMSEWSYLHYHEIPFIVALTKADKLKKSQLAKTQAEFETLCLPYGCRKVVLTSGENGYGIPELQAVLNEAVAEEDAEEDAE